MHSERLGTGHQHIIILHGWGHSLESMRPLADILAQTCSVHLIDLPGFGKSPAPTDVWSSFDYAKCLENYLDSQNLKKVVVIGHSFGGKVAFSWAHQSPKVEKLVLISSSGLKAQRSFPKKLRLVGLRYLSKVYKTSDCFFGTAYHEAFSKRYGSADYQKAGNMRPIMVKSVNEDLAHILKKVQTPTLLLWGENDTETPKEMGMRFKELMPNSKLILFPLKGHGLPLSVGSHLCARYILPFLEESHV